MTQKLRQFPTSSAGYLLALLASLGLTSESVREWMTLAGEFLKNPLALTLAILVIAVLLVALLLNAHRDRAALMEELQRSQTCILAMSMILSQDPRFRGKLPDAQQVIDGELSLSDWMNQLNALNVPTAQGLHA